MIMEFAESDSSGRRLARPERSPVVGRLSWRVGAHAVVWDHAVGFAWSDVCWHVLLGAIRWCTNVESTMVQLWYYELSSIPV
jgi:hypothetical protein